MPPLNPGLKRHFCANLSILPTMQRAVSSVQTSRNDLPDLVMHASDQSLRFLPERAKQKELNKQKKEIYNINKLDVYILIMDVWMT